MMASGPVIYPCLLMGTSREEWITKYSDIISSFLCCILVISIIYSYLDYYLLQKEEETEVSPLIYYI